MHWNRFYTASCITSLVAGLVAALLPVEASAGGGVVISVGSGWSSYPRHSHRHYPYYSYPGVIVAPSPYYSYYYTPPVAPVQIVEKPVYIDRPVLVEKTPERAPDKTASGGVIYQPISVAYGGRTCVVPGDSIVEYSSGPPKIILRSGTVYYCAP